MRTGLEAPETPPPPPARFATLAATTSSDPPVATPVMRLATDDAMAVIKPEFVSLLLGLMVIALPTIAAVEVAPLGAFWVMVIALPATPVGTAVQVMPSGLVVLPMKRLALVTSARVRLANRAVVEAAVLVGRELLVASI